MLKKYTYIIIIILITTVSCKKEQVEHIGEVVDYTTNSETNQVFKYYYDDGEYVAGGLDEYIAAIHTKLGTFNNEQLLLMTYKSSSSTLPDSIIPFSYILGTNYTNPINKEVEFHINTNYPYNNDAHKEYTEELFFKTHIHDMILYKFEKENNGEYYYDPNITREEYPFTFNEGSNDIIFNTKDIASSYVLCWKEKQWTDSISFNIQDGALSNNSNIIEKGIKNNTNNEGVIYKNNILHFEYTDEERHYSQSSNTSGWEIKNINLRLINPIQGELSNNNIFDNIIIYDQVALYTHLLVTENTNIELIEMPDFGEYGKLRISGQMGIECYQREVTVDLEIYYYRQR